MCYHEVSLLDATISFKSMQYSANEEVGYVELTLTLNQMVPFATYLELLEFVDNDNELSAKSEL